MHKRLPIALAAVAASLAVTAATAAADYRIETFDVSLSTLQAGGHPDVTVAFTLGQTTKNGAQFPDGMIRDVTTVMPAGLVGDPSVTPMCPRAKLLANVCPKETQVGVTSVLSTNPGVTKALANMGVYNLEPPKGQAAEFGFNALGIAPVYMDIGIRSDGDYGLNTELRSLSQVLPVTGTTLTLWGVPSDHNGSGAARRPFMTNVAGCDQPLTTAIKTRPWHSDVWQTATSTTATAPTGCDSLRIAPALDVAADSPKADGPSGYRVTMTLPQNTDPDGLATPPLRQVDVTLPLGTSMNPSAADGLATCTDDQFAAHSGGAAGCPDASRVGTVSIESPLVPAPLTGVVYLLAGTASQPYRMGIDAFGTGTRVKTVGSVKADPTTGQPTTSFTDVPPVPMTRLTMAFKGGPRALLATARTCGPQNSSLSAVSWGGATATATSGYVVEGDNCALSPFGPSLIAGSTNALAGGHTGFSMTLTRADGSPGISRLRMDLPPGLLGRLDAVAPCPLATAIAAACADANRIGTASIAAGAGSQPVHLTGAVYLTFGEPGALGGMAIVLPGRVGPFDLGTIVVRSRIIMEPDMHMRIESDPLPQVLGGVPLRIRSIGMNLDRKGFMINPTSCVPGRVSAVVGGAGGEVATTESPYQVSGCSKLAFAPRMKVALGDRFHTKKGRKTPVRVTISQKPGEARMRSVAVRLPEQLVVRPKGMSTMCSAEELAASQCPVSARIGKASIKTPLLGVPLSGPVFLASSSSGLPKLAVQIRGLISMDLEAQLAILRSGAITATFGSLPDVPVTQFTLSLPPGENAPLAIGADLCASPRPTAWTRTVAHGGQTKAAIVLVSVAGCVKTKKRHSPRRRGGTR